jgi:hypothetical protein
MIMRTKRLTLNRALTILQLNYGTQVQRLEKVNHGYLADSICMDKRLFTREEILNLEDEMYNTLFGV